MVEATMNDDRKVKVTKKQAGKLRNFFKKIKDRVKDGLSTVPYIPGATFDFIRKLPSNIWQKAKSKRQMKDEAVDKVTDDEETKENAIDNSGFNDDFDKDFADLDKITDGLLTSDELKNTKENEPAQAIDIPLSNTKKKGKQKVINGKSFDDIFGKVNKTSANSKAETKKNDVPQEVNKKEEKAERIPMDDLTKFETYYDYKVAYFWNYYINIYNIDELSKFSKEFASWTVVKDGTHRDILTETEYTAKRDSQIMAQEKAKIKAENDEMNARLDRARDAEIQKAKDELQSTIDGLNTRLDENRMINELQQEQLRIYEEALEQIKQKSDLVGIQSITDIINGTHQKLNELNEKSEKKNENTKSETVKDENAQKESTKKADSKTSSQELDPEIEKKAEEKKATKKEQKKETTNTKQNDIEKKEETTKVSNNKTEEKKDDTKVNPTGKSYYVDQFGKVYDETGRKQKFNDIDQNDSVYYASDRKQQFNEPASKTENDNFSLVNELDNYEAAPSDNWKNTFVPNTLDEFVKAEQTINNSNKSQEEKAEERKELYSHFDQFSNAFPETDEKYSNDKFVPNSLDDLAKAEQIINNSDKSPEEKARDRQALYDYFDQISDDLSKTAENTSKGKTR